MFIDGRAQMLDDGQFRELGVNQVLSGEVGLVAFFTDNVGHAQAYYQYSSKTNPYAF